MVKSSQNYTLFSINFLMIVYAALRAAYPQKEGGRFLWAGNAIFATILFYVHFKYITGLLHRDYQGQEATMQPENIQPSTSQPGLVTRLWQGFRAAWLDVSGQASKEELVSLTSAKTTDKSTQKPRS